MEQANWHTLYFKIFNPNIERELQLTDVILFYEGKEYQFIFLGDDEDIVAPGKTRVLKAHREDIGYDTMTGEDTGIYTPDSISIEKAELIIKYEDDGEARLRGSSNPKRSKGYYF